MDRSRRASLVPWEPLERHVTIAFTVAGTSLLASLFAPFALLAIVDWSWLVGISLVGVTVIAAALGLFGLYPDGRRAFPRLAITGTAFATLAGVAGMVVLVLSALTGVAIQSPGHVFSVGKPAFVVLSLTMAVGYGLGFLSFGIGTLRSGASHGREGHLLTVGGVLLLLLVGGGVLQVGFGFDMPAWVVFLAIGLVAIDTITVGLHLRSTS